MPIVRTHRAHYGGLGQQQYGPGAICLDENQNTISCASPDCRYGDCGSTMPQITTGALCLNQAENAVACTDPECFYGDCINVPMPPGSGGNPLYPEGGLPQGTTPGTVTVPQVTPKPSPTITSTPGMPPGYQPGLYPQPSVFSWFGQSTMFGTTAIPNWLFAVGGLGLVLVASRMKG